MVTIHIAAVIVVILVVATLGALAGSLGASSGGGDRLADALDRAALLEREASVEKGSRSAWKYMAEIARDQRDGTEKAFERATTALSWLVEEAPGLDAALGFPSDAADIIERVEALRKDLGRRDATDAWRDFADFQ